VRFVGAAGLVRNGQGAVEDDIAARPAEYDDRTFSTVVVYALNTSVS